MRVFFFFFVLVVLVVGLPIKVPVRNPLVQSLPTLNVTMTSKIPVLVDIVGSPVILVYIYNVIRLVSILLQLSVFSQLINVYRLHFAHVAFLQKMRLLILS